MLKSKRDRLVKMINEAISDLEALSQAYDAPAMSPEEVAAATGESLKDVQYYPEKFDWHSTKLDKILTDDDFQEIKLFAIEEFIDAFMNSIKPDQAKRIMSTPSEYRRLRQSLVETAEFKTFLNDFLLRLGNKYAVSAEKGYREEIAAQHGISDSTANAIMNMILARVNLDQPNIRELKKRFLKDGKTEAQADAYVSTRMSADVKKYRALFSHDIVDGAMKAYEKQFGKLSPNERLKKIEGLQTARKAEFGDIMAMPKAGSMTQDEITEY